MWLKSIVKVLKCRKYKHEKAAPLFVVFLVVPSQTFFSCSNMYFWIVTFTNINLELCAMLLTFLHIYRRIVLSPCMQMKMAGCFASKVALTTFVGLFSCVLALVSFQIPCLSGRIVALITFKRHFSRMLEFVSSHINILLGRIAALFTLEWLLSCMCPCVRFKVSSCSTGVATLRTAEGLLFRMCPYVCFKVTSLSARVVTLRAAERLFLSVFQWVFLEFRSLCTRKGA